MHLTVEQTYPASVDDVAAMLADASFVRWRAERTTGGGSVDQADVDADDAGGFTVLVRRTLPTDQIPAQARPFVGARLEVRQAEVWEPPQGDHRVGTVALEITGAPVRLTGTVALEPSPDGGTRQVYTGDVRATVPLFASVVEQATVGTVRAALTAEELAGREWLAGVR
ncbi:DUF2505 domain-containing protein [Xylanimonas allomyrinae]|uniref:DUF2505 domain-containing protein n=1 Tax=Xylanimonas allomyrinae TaxID=2509459 RepID=A0A4P6EPW0_9MICO|nr:DUF2505 domain-containing protein [Xylanimonas allomyrinae]QAY63419.1 DUF2505 domain-containing protein [Xylanimonas allomyrinae]